MIWGSCCALLLVVLFTATPRRPAGAEEVGLIGEKGNAAVENSVGYLETIQPPEIAAKRRINKILDTRIIAPLEYPNTPLSEILNILQDDHDLPIVIDRSSLDEIGISAEQEVTVNLRKITLRSALELILRQIHDLDYTIQNQVLLITTQEAEAEHLELRVYRVDDLLDPDRQLNGADSEELYRQLIMVITRTLEQDSWQRNGTGEGHIQPLKPGMLIIAQTQRIHRKIMRLLADIREVRRTIDAG
jgi:hypothetical protein